MNFIIRFVILTLFLIGFVVFFEGSGQYIKIHGQLDTLQGYKPFGIFMLVLTLLNIFLKPLLKLLTLPLSCMTLGLFSIVINLIVVMVADHLVTSFDFTSWKYSFIFSILFSVLNSVIEYFMKNDD